MGLGSKPQTLETLAWSWQEALDSRKTIPARVFEEAGHTGLAPASDRSINLHT